MSNTKIIESIDIHLVTGEVINVTGVEARNLMQNITNHFNPVNHSYDNRSRLSGPVINTKSQKKERIVYAHIVKIIENEN